MAWFSLRWLVNRREGRRFNNQSKVQDLAGLPALARCRKADLEFLATQTDVWHFEPGEVLKHAGRPCSELLIVVEGEVEGGEGTRLGPGSVIGGEQMWDRTAEPISIVATTQGRLLVMGHSQFRAWKAVFGPSLSKQPAAARLTAFLTPILSAIWMARNRRWLGRQVPN
jgi:CRP-like cAMP-binding protein